MIRASLLYLVLFGLVFQATRDWFKALCGLILLMGVCEHPDMPKTLFGVQGLSPWNVLLVVVLVAWARARRQEGLSWDLPRHVRNLFLVYFAVILAGTVRMLADPTNLEQETTTTLVSEHLINTMKWVIPGFLLFDGCRSRERFHWAVASVLGVYVLLALQVMRWMPPSCLLDSAELTRRSRKVLMHEIGFHAVTLSMLLAGASWAVYSVRDLAIRASPKRLIAAGALGIVFAQALTAGRMGYAAWAVIGLVLALLRWRKVLVLGPIVVAVVVWIAPAARERMGQGFAKENEFFGTEAATDDYEVTSGRTLIWPYVEAKIAEEPLFGHGRLAMIRTGVAGRLAKLGEEFPHPHNAYFEMLLDNGALGLALVLPFYVLVVARAVSLFRDGRSPIFIATGGMTLALVLALLVAGIGSQSFYPVEAAVGMWCAIGLTLRVTIERARAGADIWPGWGRGPPVPTRAAERRAQRRLRPPQRSPRSVLAGSNLLDEA